MDGLVSNKTFYGTSSTRRAFSRGSKHRWVVSLDRRDLLGTAWAIDNNEALYFTNHPSLDGARFVILRRYYGARGPLTSEADLPKGVRVANLQEGYRARFWIDLAYFRPMQGDPDTKVELLENGDLRVYYPPRLTTGRPTVDAVMHGKRQGQQTKPSPALVREITIREYK